MQVARLTSSAHEPGVSTVNGVTVQRTRWWETAYTAVSWDYPPSPAAYHDALLCRGASHSRFLRIAYSSTRERFITSAPRSPVPHSTTSSIGFLDTSTTPAPPYRTSTTSLDGSPRKSAVRPPSIPPYSLSWPCVNVRPRSANPTSHALKRRKPQWPKPPHYHALLLRSPLSRRKGLFRAVLPPNKAVDFFRWDILPGANTSLATPSQERDRTRASDANARASLLVAESVLEPYEAAAGFFGWNGLGPNIVRRVQENHDEDMECWSEGVEVCRLTLEHDGARMSSSSDPQLEIDEARVEEGWARWAHTAEKLVGPPGLALRWVVEDRRSGKVTAPSDSVPKHAVDARVPSSVSSRREEVRWNPDIIPSPSCPTGPTSASDAKRQLPPFSSTATVSGPSSSFKPELKTDSPSPWWYGPSPHRAPPPIPPLPSLRFPPPPSVQYGPQPPQFSSWLPPGRVGSVQGHGYWCGAQPSGTSSSMDHDLNPPKSLPPHSHIFAPPVTPTSMYPSQPPRHPVKPNLGRNHYGLGHDYDKETETDHGYESTTTTTDSDPPPHTPIGAATTSHCVETSQVHGDDEVEVRGVETDLDHAAAPVMLSLSDPTTPVKFPGGFSMSTSSSVSSGSPGSNRDGYGSSKAAVVFPSLNGSFRQGSLSQMSLSLSTRGASAQTAPATTLTSVTSSSLLSAKELTTQLGHGNEDDSKIKLQSRDACSVSDDKPAFIMNLCSPPPTSPRPGFRKDSQGFWEPMTPVSSSSSSSSPPRSLSEVKIGSRSTPRRIGEKTWPMLGESVESSEATSSPFAPSAKSRSLSPGPSRVISVESTRWSSSWPASSSSPTSTPGSTSVFGGSYPSSPSPTNSSSLVPTTLLPSFLATTPVKRKRTSRTREIVDRLRSSSIDAGKGGVGSDSLGWPASPSAGGELDDALCKVSSVSDHGARDHGQLSPSLPYKSNPDSVSWLGSDLGKKNYGQTSKSFDSDFSGSAGKSNGVTHASETLFSLASPGTVMATVNPSITPFPILSVSQTSASTFTITHQSQNGGATGRQPVTAMPSNGADGTKMNATAATSPNARSSGPQLLPSTSNGGTSPSTHHSHQPLPSPSHPTVHPQSPLGPPHPMLTLSPCPHPMYVPFTPYQLALPHQGQQGQGPWLPVYPGRPPHLPVHPLPAQTHAPPITRVSAIRHVSW